MLNLKKIFELVAGTTLQDSHELPVSEGNGAGQTKKYNIGQLKAFISSYILQQISGITKGDQGPQGATGAQGIQGEKGEKGDKGDKGDQGLKGEQGLQGPIGIQGPIGVKGDKGDTGAQGVQGIKGDKGDKGDQGDAGTNGDNGNDGISAYEVAVNNGFVGTEADWLESLKGEKGDQGDAGEQGPQGEQGEAGANGNDGISAYEVAVNNGFVGTEADWLESLKGEKGDQGDAGEQGPQGEQGEAGANGNDGATGAPGVGVPTGGTTGQVLKKSSNSNYATEWGDAGVTVSTDAENQAGAINNKAVSPLGLKNWFTWIKTQASTISGNWNFTGTLKRGGSDVITQSDATVVASEYFMTAKPSGLGKDYEAIDLYLAIIDDTGGVKTSIELNALYPNSKAGQRIEGTAGRIYEKRSSSIWAYWSITTA